MPLDSPKRKDGDLLAEVLHLRAVYAGLGDAFVRADYVTSNIDEALDRANPRDSEAR